MDHEIERTGSFYRAVSAVREMASEILILPTKSRNLLPVPPKSPRQVAFMSKQLNTYLKFGSATLVIFFLLGYLAYTGVQDSKSYYVTINELHRMGNSAYSKRLRVAGNVQPGSIKRTGTHVQFVLLEQDQSLSVDYTGTEAPPDTFKDDSQALADGSFGHDGVFHAKALQAKCASKYAPQQPANGTPGSAPKNMTQVQPASRGIAN
jgi:cytochrome c-type biogenesis protein CcmE